MPLTNVPISTSVSGELLMPPADTFTPQKKGKIKSNDSPNAGKHSEGLQRKSRAKKRRGAESADHAQCAESERSLQ